MQKQRSSLILYIKYCLLFFPFVYRFANKCKSLFFRSGNIPYPNSSSLELFRVAEVLSSSGWNMNYGKGLIHEKLEKEFGKYIQSDHAIAVNTGGMALQIILRALGLKPGDEVLHQVDTCVATSYAIINSFCTPVFADIDLNTFMLSHNDILNNITERTKIIMPIHMWGNAENMSMIKKIAIEKKLLIVEDACLSLGAEWEKKKVGNFGIASAFSFGCLKPVQAGEGGMIVTNDSNLAKEIRILRDWGETTKELGYRDQQHLSWNGRMSEFVAAIALEQLKVYPEQLKKVRENVILFSTFIDKINGLKIIHKKNESAYSQIVLQIDNAVFPISKNELMAELKKNNISVWHANFEPVNSLSFFSNTEWKNWILKGDYGFIQSNYNNEFVNANKIFKDTGIGINKIYFLSKRSTKEIIKKIEKVFINKKIFPNGYRN